jgi:hypothetical protein
LQISKNLLYLCNRFEDVGLSVHDFWGWDWRAFSWKGKSPNKLNISNLQDFYMHNNPVPNILQHFQTFRLHFGRRRHRWALVQSHRAHHLKAPLEIHFSVTIIC